MVKTKLNIPATLVHTVKGKKYKLNGMLLSINESDDTCTMRFNGKLEKDIPMSKIYINEGFIDKIKEYGKKIANYITQKVNGFVALVDEAAQTVMSWSINNVANLAIMASKHQLPSGVCFAGSSTLKDLSGVNTMSFDLAFAESMAKDRKMITDYWTRVMNRAGSTENESIEESIKYVNENFYTSVKGYKPLNEVVYSYSNIKTKSGQGLYGSSMSSEDLKNELRSNIMKQISGPLGGHADEVPYLIWGAPGIGKTAIIKSLIKELAEDEYDAINLNLETIMLGGYTIENWTLPENFDKTVAGVELHRFKDHPKAWLPVYEYVADPDERAKRDMFCNTCKFKSDNEEGDITGSNGHPYEGGIVFMDEYSRVDPKVQKIIMGITNEHMFGDDYCVASKWGFIFAANRAIDDNEADSEDTRYFPVPAQINRFRHVTYVPDKTEWITWARTVDDLTGEANVPPFIVDFIEASPDHVWYSTVVNGGYDDMLEKPEVDKKVHLNADNDLTEIQDVLDQVLLKTTKRMITPRTWANVIGPSYKKELIYLFRSNEDGLTGEEYYKKLVKQSTIDKVDSEGVSYKDYYGGILPDTLVDALNNIDDRYWEHWVKIKGGRKKLDPANQFYGVKGRYEMLMAWFVNEVFRSMNDSSDTTLDNTTNPALVAWKAYQNYAKIFTPDVIESIWETGKMTQEYQKDDDKKPDNVADFFAQTKNSKWKGSSTIVFEVCKNVWDQYPGDLESDMKEDIQALKTAPKLSDADVTKEALKLIKEYEFKLNNKAVNLLFDKKDLADIETLRNKVTSLLYSKVAQNFTHVATWFAKVCLLSEVGNVGQKYEKAIFDVINGTDDKTPVDTEIAHEFSNSNAIFKAANLVKTHVGDKAIKRNLTVEESKVPVVNAIAILHRTKTYDWNTFHGK